MSIPQPWFCLLLKHDKCMGVHWIVNKQLTTWTVSIQILKLQLFNVVQTSRTVLSSKRHKLDTYSILDTFFGRYRRTSPVIPEMTQYLWVSTKPSRRYSLDPAHTVHTLSLYFPFLIPLIFFLIFLIQIPTCYLNLPNATTASSLGK